MRDIEKQLSADSKNLSKEYYFSSILQKAYTFGLLNDSDIENIQLQCIQFLAYKIERFNGGYSSSIRVEAAENIMQSNLYTIGLYLKSLPNSECAVKELKTNRISEMYKKGRSLIDIKVHSSKHLYYMTKANKIITSNNTYNATIDDNGLGIFFKLYNPDYGAHEVPASIDYQLCNQVTDLTGIEFIQKYLENLYLENQFCSYFKTEDIHYLLCGYDEGYKDLLINIFEQVFTSALGCILANHSLAKLDLSKGEIQNLYNELSKDDKHLLALKISKAADKLQKELNITQLALLKYMDEGLANIKSSIISAVRTNTLDKTFVSPINPNLKPKIQFIPRAKMEDDDYRKFINELLDCRFSADKLALIKEKAKSFGDIEDLLFDAQLSKEEIILVLGILEDVEIAELVKRHPYNSTIQAEDLSEEEQELRSYLKGYIDQLRVDRQEQILKLVDHLV